MQYKNLSWLWISMIIVILDRLSKSWIIEHLSLGQSIKVFPFFNIIYTYNRGAAFSFLNEAGGWQAWLFVIIAIGVSIFIIFWLFRLTKKQTLGKLSLALILGGTIGNLYDRIMYKHVIDFLDFYISSWHYPVFNVADSAICIGAIILIIELIWKRKTL